MKLTLVLSTILLVLAGCTAEPEAAKEASIQVNGEIATLAEPDKATFLKLAAVERDTGGMLRLPGRLVWNEEKTVRVFPQLGGRVQSIAVDVGNAVKINQSLAVLNSPDYGQALADARKAGADAQVAAQALERNRQLREAGVVAEKDWQLAEAASVAARAEAQRASRRLAGLGGDGDGAYILRSPLAGVVVERNLNPGMEFRADQATAPLFVVTDPGSLWIQIDAGEADLANLKAGEPLLIESRQFPGERFKGVIRHVADFVDPQPEPSRYVARCPTPIAASREKCLSMRWWRCRPRRRFECRPRPSSCLAKSATFLLRKPPGAIVARRLRREVNVKAGSICWLA